MVTTVHYSAYPWDEDELIDDDDRRAVKRERRAWKHEHDPQRQPKRTFSDRLEEAERLMGLNEDY